MSDGVMRQESDGWTSYPGGVHVRMTERDGRMVVTDLFVSAEEITATTLRSIPLGRIEAAANAQGREAEAARFFAQAGEDFGDDDTTLGDLRARAPRKVARSRRTKPLGRPDGNDGFYMAVSQKYRQLAASTRSPAAAIAAESEVPVTTVHRWIRETRRRGFLPPGRKGKVG